MGNWSNEGRIDPQTFHCGHCGNKVGSASGWSWGGRARLIYVCPFCDKPTYFEGSTRIPDAIPGNEVAGLPPDIDVLYREARRCVGISAYTASAITSRKLLAHIAVQKGAAGGKSFLDYVEYLAGAGYIPPDGKGWVDHIRRKGNEAAHEIRLVTREEAEELVSFLEMLLKFVFEFPSRVPPSS